MLRRRLARCAGLLPALRRNPPDIHDPAWAAVIDAVTVQETRLFRHPALLAAVEAAVLPTLRAAAGREGRRPLRSVSAGCTTGEEVYTLAMLALGPPGERPRATVEVLGGSGAATHRKPRRASSASGQATRRAPGRPSSAMRFSARTANVASTRCASEPRERSPPPSTRLSLEKVHSMALSQMTSSSSLSDWRLRTAIMN